VAYATKEELKELQKTVSDVMIRQARLVDELLQSIRSAAGRIETVKEEETKQ